MKASFKLLFCIAICVSWILFFKGFVFLQNVLLHSRILNNAYILSLLIPTTTLERDILEKLLLWFSFQINQFRLWEVYEFPKVMWRNQCKRIFCLTLYLEYHFSHENILIGLQASWEFKSEIDIMPEVTWRSFCGLPVPVIT